eukprot:scaffold29892_cov79-Isochrysis_galbana.AAC.1
MPSRRPPALSIFVLLPTAGGGLLGVTIRFDIARPLEKHTLHVLDVYPSSPASAAGATAALPLTPFSISFLSCRNRDL